MLALLIAMYAQAQQPVARLEYEVVSVKPGDANFNGSSAGSTPGGVQWRNTTLYNLVRGAYDLNEFQLEGGPKWANTARFNIDAKYPAGATRDQNPLMIRTLLSDRFKLVFHRETRTLPEYALVVAKGGPKLAEASQDDKRRGSTSQGDRMIRAFGIPLSSLARMLISAVGAPVIDRTGLDGIYDFDLKFARLDGLPTPADDALPSLFAVIQQLGLKLEPIKGPVEVVVIDKAEMPAEN